MKTDQATLVLASLLRSGRRFQSHDLGQTTRQRIATIQQLLEEYEEKLSSPDATEAPAKLAEAYRLLKAEPPSGAEQTVLAAVNQAEPTAETNAWQAFLAEFFDG